jgi:hypothetical protein
MTGLSSIGISETDFTGNAYADFAESVTLVPVTEDQAGFRGGTVQVFSGTSTISAIFHIFSKGYTREKDGIRFESPAFLMSRASDNVKRGDKIIVGTGTGNTWKVQNTISRRGIYVYSELYSWE